MEKVVILALAAVIISVSDQQCIGTCQDDSNKCSGSYASGLCPGGVTNRCCTSTLTETDTGFCSDFELTIISRDSWGARRPRSTSLLTTTPVKKVFIHHTTGDNCASFSLCANKIKGFQNFHMDVRNWFDIGYSFLVGEDGRIYEGRGWDRTGAHNRGHNHDSLGIAFVGEFTKTLPNNAARNALIKLINCGVSKDKIATPYTLLGHGVLKNSELLDTLSQSLT